jgi:hypothetical protein
MRWLGIFTLLLVASAASAKPLDLRDASPREIQVAFEVSPTERPDALGLVYSKPLPASLEPGFAPTQRRVRVPAAAMESLLAHFDPVSGSFSDYVWTFDAETGEVLSASFQGVLRRPLDLGLFAAHIETHIEVRVATHHPIGYRAPRVRLGQVVVGTCEPGAGEDCTAMLPLPLDPRTGYVNAVGTIQARAAGGLGALTFAPLGEAIFSERADVPAVSLAAD